jgi:hypothetical protein
MQLLRNFSIGLVSVVLLLIEPNQVFAQRVKQSRDVIEAYRVCNRFQQLLAEDLDFDRAYEETFSRNPTRRRAIAIADGEFGHIDFAKVDNTTLIKAYKSRMQTMFFTLLLIDPEKSESSLPPRIDEIYSRGLPDTPEDFRLYADMLKEDVAELRAYLSRDPTAAERLRQFKGALAKPLVVPNNYVIKPLTSYSEGRVLAEKEPYYQIEYCEVIREGSEMKIIGIRFFNLF